MKFGFGVIFENLSENSSFIKIYKNKANLNEDLYTFMTISCSVLRRMRNVSEKSCEENQNTPFLCYIIFFFENRAANESVWKNIVESDRPQMTIWRMRIALWIITKAAGTSTEYVTLTAITLQQ